MGKERIDKNRNADIESAGLRFLYNTIPGRLILRPLTSPFISRITGHFLDSHLSSRLIPHFVRKNNIDLSDYEDEDYKSFNQFFTRKIRAELRPVPSETGMLMAPCDGLLSVCDIKDGLVLPVKQSRYTVSSLLANHPVAASFDGGLCLVFRLCVDNYHRYCYIDSGIPKDTGFISGKFHTIRPIALRKVPVFTENSRAYTLLESENFGTIAQIEVGAMLVGKILNHKVKGRVLRGQEKGMFLYGGSTVIVLVPKGKALIDKEIRDASDKGLEFPVIMGQIIGHKM